MLDITKLTIPEREQYNQLQTLTRPKNLTLDDLREHVKRMLFAVTEMLANTPNNDDEKNTLLKAQIKNYLTYYRVLESPVEGAQAAQKALQDFENTMEKVIEERK